MWLVLFSYNTANILTTYYCSASHTRVQLSLILTIVQHPTYMCSYHQYLLLFSISHTCVAITNTYHCSASHTCVAITNTYYCSVSHTHVQLSLILTIVQHPTHMCSYHQYLLLFSIPHTCVAITYTYYYLIVNFFLVY